MISESEIISEVFQMTSHVSASVTWQEGKEEDFKELREGLEKMRSGAVTVKEAAGGDQSSDSSDSQLEDLPTYMKYGVNEEEEEDSDDDDDVDPGDEKPGERLLWAAQHNRLEVVTSLLTSDPSLVHYTDSDRYTALHRAAYSHHLPVLELLLQQGADPLARTEDGWTALHSAARWNSYQCVERLLLEVPANVLTDGGHTPLHLTCQTNSRETLELLLSHPDIDPSIVNCQVSLYTSVRTDNDCLPSLQGDRPVDVARRMGSLAPLFEAVTPAAVLSHKEK